MGGLGRNISSLAEAHVCQEFSSAAPERLVSTVVLAEGWRHSSNCPQDQSFARNYSDYSTVKLSFLLLE